MMVKVVYFFDFSFVFLNNYISEDIEEILIQDEKYFPSMQLINSALQLNFLLQKHFYIKFFDTIYKSKNKTFQFKKHTTYTTIMKMKAIILNFWM